MATIFVFLESANDTPLTGASPTLDFWDKSSPGSPTTGVAMTELTTGIGGGYFVDVATTDGREYLGIVDGTGSAKAGARYHLVTFSGETDARIEADLPAILVDTDATIPGLIAALNDFDPATESVTLTPAERTALRDFFDATHGAGSWVGTAAQDWTSGEREQIRDALGVDGSKTAATGGDVQDILLDTDTTIPGLIAALNDLDAGDVWAYDITANFDGLTDRDQAGGALLWARILDTNRQEIDTATDRINIYNDAGTLVVAFAPLLDFEGNTIVGLPGAPARRSSGFS